MNLNSLLHILTNWIIESNNSLQYFSIVSSKIKDDVYTIARIVIETENQRFLISTPRNNNMTIDLPLPSANTWVM